MFELAKAGSFLLSPLTVVTLLGGIALLLAGWGRRRAAAATGIASYTLLWVASMPATAYVLQSSLENMHPAQPIAALPRADAIVVLGGALSGASPPQRPSFIINASGTRVWHAALLYQAGKAPLVIVAAGNVPQEAHVQPEAQAIAEMLQGLGVPRHALLLDTLSRNTRENARKALPLAQAAGVRSALLVTSATHMERALRTFDHHWAPSGIRVTPAPVDHRAFAAPAGLNAWLPTVSALAVVTSTIREFAGIAAVGIM